MRKTFTFKLTFTAILTSLAVLSFVLEGLFPPLIIPGARMGISNIFILLAVILLGNVYGYAVFIIKVTLGSLFAGNISALMYSLPSGLISLTTQVLLLLLCKKFSVVAISTFGSVINILLQNVTFCLVTNTAEYLYYSPYLALLGVLSGITVGFTVYVIIKIFPQKLACKLDC